MQFRISLYVHARSDGKVIQRDGTYVSTATATSKAFLISFASIKIRGELSILCGVLCGVLLPDRESFPFSYDFLCFEECSFESLFSFSFSIFFGVFLSSFSFFSFFNVFWILLMESSPVTSFSAVETDLKNNE